MWLWAIQKNSKEKLGGVGDEGSANPIGQRKIQRERRYMIPDTLLSVNVKHDVLRRKC